MSSCLGLYIDNNIIKYAKISKESDNIKVESFGVKFYDKIGEAIDQVVEETYSQKTPISVNISEEMYNYFTMYALLKKNDLQKAVQTEFEVFCSDKGYNPNVFETRYAVVDSKLDRDQLKIIHIADNKIELNKRVQQFADYHLGNISPISISIANLADIDKNENSIIVNMEDQTTITTIIDGKVFNIDIIEEGSKNILDKINLKENSYSKSYEIAKNTTIYTSEGNELQASDEENYLPDIMPTLYNIVGQVKKIINSTTEKFDKVYLTGTAALINNADLYFQEYLEDISCEVLKPYFIENIGNISIKDYIEVNSAISLALMGLGEGISGMNFKKKTFVDQIPSWLKVEVTPGKSKKQTRNTGGFFTWDLGQKMDKTEKGLVRIAVSLFLLVTIYSAFSGMLSYQMEQKEQEATDFIAQTNAQISLANKDNEKIKSKTNEYTAMIRNLEEANDRITDRNKTRNAIPNLLNQLMTVIPEQVQLTSIENTTGSHVVINAQSSKYEQLGFFVAKLKNEAKSGNNVILTNVTSTAGQKDNSVVTIKIEGDLP